MRRNAAGGIFRRLLLWLCVIMVCVMLWNQMVLQGVCVTREPVDEAVSWVGTSHAGPHKNDPYKNPADLAYAQRFIMGQSVKQRQEDADESMRVNKRMLMDQDIKKQEWLNKETAHLQSQQFNNQAFLYETIKNQQHNERRIQGVHSNAARIKRNQTSNQRITADMIARTLRRLSKAHTPMS